MKICDVSYFNGDIDWSKAAKELDFAIIRATAGRAVDKKYEQNREGCEKNGIPYHVYHAVNAHNMERAMVEAENFYNATKGDKALFHVLDCENQTVTDANKEEPGYARKMIKAFVKRLKELDPNMRVAAYIGYHVYEDWNLDTSDFAYVWIPRYEPNATEPGKKPKYPCDLWQYTQKGRMAGASGNIDLNMLMGTKPLEFFTTGKMRMKISLRPAPHSKNCALHGTSCSLFQNAQEKCEAQCPNRCCEMKHCWVIGEALQDELEKRGHTVYMANKKYRKRWPEDKAAQATKDAMAELNAHKPQLHMAIHTNASSNERSRGIQAMYPPARYGERTEKSISACKAIANELKKVYDLPDKVTTREYSATETNTCPGAGVYLELGYGNTNVKDAEFVHKKVAEIAKALADGIEAWGISQGYMDGEVKPVDPIPDETPEAVKLVAYLKASYIWQLNLWNDTQKTESLAVIKHNVPIYLHSDKPVDGYYSCYYEGKDGFVDARYIKVTGTAAPEDKGTYLRKKKSYIWQLNLWSDTKKTKSLAVIGADAMKKLENAKKDGYYHVRSREQEGYVNAKYVEEVE